MRLDKTLFVSVFGVLVISGFFISAPERVLAAEPAGVLTVANCAPTAVGGSCAVSTSWTTQNSFYTPTMPLSVVNVIDNATGNFVGGSPVAGVSYYQNLTSPNGSYVFHLRKGSYTLALYGWAHGAYVLLDQKPVTVVEQPQFGITPLTLMRNSSSATKVVHGSGSSQFEEAVFRLSFDVSASNDDAYITKSALRGIIDNAGATFVIKGANGSAVTGGMVSSASLTSTADTDGARYKVNQGETKTFTLYVTYRPAVAGFYTMGLQSLNFSNINVAPNLHAVPSRAEDFQTDIITVLGSTGTPAVSPTTVPQGSVQVVSVRNSAVSRENSLTTLRDNQGVFTLVFDATAVDGNDAYFNKSALRRASTSTAISAGGVSFIIKDANGTEVTDGSATAVLTSTADTDGTRYKVNQGETKTFTVTVSFDPVRNGSYRAQLTSFNFNAVNTNPNNSRPFPLTGVFQTSALSILDSTSTISTAVVAATRAVVPAPRVVTTNTTTNNPPATPSGTISASACVIGSGSTLQPTRTDVCDSKVSWSTTNAATAYVVITGHAPYGVKSYPYGFTLPRFVKVSGSQVPFWTPAGTYTLALYASGTQPTNTAAGTGTKLSETTITVAPAVTPASTSSDGGADGGATGTSTSSGEGSAMLSHSNLSQIASVLSALQQLLNYLR